MIQGLGSSQTISVGQFPDRLENWNVLYREQKLKRKRQRFVIIDLNFQILAHVFVTYPKQYTAQ